MRSLIVKAGKHITDCMDVAMGITPMTEDRPEYKMLDAILTDDMARIILKMKVRKHYSLGEVSKKLGWSESKVEPLLERMAQLGIVEYKRNPQNGQKEYYVPVFVVGSAENLVYSKELYKEMPDLVSDFSYQMSLLPLKTISHMVPPGGAGLGFHVIPVEKAIPKESQSLDIEHLSYWLDRFRDKGQFAIAPCQCRRAMAARGEGCGELEDNVCIVCGEYADYMIETNKDVTKATYDEIIELLERTEENGYMHQITNGDGPDEIFAICNCTVGSCFGLRCSQLYNQPNLSASAYRARVTAENCVACGKCVEVCPSGAAKLGQKLCTTCGPIEYPKVRVPDETLDWGEKDWNYNFREDNQINCYETGTAPCKTACPAHIAIQGYIKMAGEGRYDEALALIKQDNPFPAVCGSICNKRCEDACTRGSVDEPVSIDAIKKFIAERELNSEHRYIPKKIRHKGDEIDYTQKIAIIGAGPAGMSCAYFLANMSYPVTVFDKAQAPGGMLTNGIPSFRLDKNVVNAEIDVLKQMGVEFKCGVEVGKDITIQQLREQGYKAFYIAIGAQKSSALGVKGEEYEGVYGGINYLRQINLGLKFDLGDSVAVIGGGNVSIDVARTAIRQGTKKVYLVYRRGMNEIKADKEEIELAEKEGIEFKLLCSPSEITADKNGKVNGIVLEKMELGKADDSGRAAAVGTGEFETIKVSSVIGAIGQQIDWGGLLNGLNVELTKKKTALCDKVTYQTSEEDIFVGGDVVTGPQFAIDAIASGREGATSIHRFVQPGQSLTVSRNLRKFNELDKSKVVIPTDKVHVEKRQVNENDESKALSMTDDRVGLSEEQVKIEASRCLGCGATVVDENKCIGCGICTTRCKFDAIHLVRSRPEFANYINGDDSKKAILKHGLERAVKLNIKKLTKK